MLILLIGLPNAGKHSIMEKAQSDALFTTDLNVDPSSVDRVWGVIDSTLTLGKMIEEFERIDRIIQESFSMVPKKGFALTKSDLKMRISRKKFCNLTHEKYTHYRTVSVSTRTYYNLNQIDSYDYLMKAI